MNRSEKDTRAQRTSDFIHINRLSGEGARDREREKGFPLHGKRRSSEFPYARSDVKNHKVVLNDKSSLRIEFAGAGEGEGKGVYYQKEGR